MTTQTERITLSLCDKHQIGEPYVFQTPHWSVYGGQVADMTWRKRAMSGECSGEVSLYRVYNWQRIRWRAIQF